MYIDTLEIPQTLLSIPWNWIIDVPLEKTYCSLQHDSNARQHYSSDFMDFYYRKKFGEFLSKILALS